MHPSDPIPPILNSATSLDASMPPVIPPEIDPTQFGESPPTLWPRRISPTRAWFAACLWVPFPVFLGAAPIWVMAALGKSSLPMGLPDSKGALAIACFQQCAIVGIWFLGIWAFVRWTSQDLLLGGLEKWRTWWLGSLYSVGIRIPVSMVMIVVMLLIIALHGGDQSVVAQYRPKIENVIQPESLTDPWYLVLTMTLVSFGMAGFPEELWRVSALTIVISLLPRTWRPATQSWVAIGITSVVFGIGHVGQGLLGVLATSILGVSLGWIMIWHRSIWYSVIAHGLFDASSFLLLAIAAKFRWLDKLLGSY